MDLFGGCWDLAGGVGQCFPAVLSERQSLRSTSSSESESSSSENRKGDKKKIVTTLSGRRASFFTGSASTSPKDEMREPVNPADALGTSPKKTADLSSERPPLVHRSSYSIGAENELHDKWNRAVVW